MSREIIEHALEQSRSPRGAHRSTEHSSLSPGRLTLGALAAGAVTMSVPGIAAAATPTDHAQRGAGVRTANVSQQVAASQQVTASQQQSGKSTATRSSELLTIGSRGSRVRELQRVLNAWYPSLTPLAQDGIYGPKTADRVRYLQRRAGIVVDGIAGPVTLGVLNMTTTTSGTTSETDNIGGGGSTDVSNPDSTTSADSSSADTTSTDSSSTDTTSTDTTSTDSSSAASSADTSDEDAAAQSAAPSPAQSVAASGVVSPTSGVVTSSYGSRSGGHDGVDIANDMGTPIYAVADGTVIDAGPASGFGLWVRVRHDDGTISVYGHIHQALVTVGERVQAGEQIATMGSRGQSTGPHLHFEIWQNGQPINPQAWLARHGVSL